MPLINNMLCIFLGQKDIVAIYKKKIRAFVGGIGGNFGVGGLVV